MNRKIHITIIICCCLFLFHLQVRAEKWEPTLEQQSLPAILVEENGVKKEYTFVDLIRADGYLCPGSAKAYKTLQVALPLLYQDTLPIKGDFKIILSSSPCMIRVYYYFMENFDSKEYLEIDTVKKGKSITISRISTGKKVTITYPPGGSRGHSPSAAQAGDAILHAEDGKGMTISI
ncbi:MAG: hypothetical protein D3923_05830 [Candidatus Electrothrix sp. AR3]|nr:hypothetical protein [Candidatus Electrothrix sp. AR3]